MPSFYEANLNSPGLSSILPRPQGPGVPGMKKLQYTKTSYFGNIFQNCFFLQEEPLQILIFSLLEGFSAILDHFIDIEGWHSIVVAFLFSTIQILLQINGTKIVIDQKLIITVDFFIKLTDQNVDEYLVDHQLALVRLGQVRLGWV